MPARSLTIEYVFGTRVYLLREFRLISLPRYAVRKPWRSLARVTLSRALDPVPYYALTRCFYFCQPGVHQNVNI